MIYRTAFIFLLIITLPVLSKTYPKVEVDRLTSKISISSDNQEFNRKFFIAENPKNYILNYIAANINKIESLYIEQRLNGLLDEVSRKRKQDYLIEFIALMKSYEINAFKLHEEGKMEVPLYNLNTRARGIENIWITQESLNLYTIALNQNPIATLSNLKYKLKNLDAPEWLGLKNSISKISTHNHIIITKYLLENIKNLQGLDKFIGHYALLTANKKLVEHSIIELDKTNSEYVLRQLSNYFEDEFVAQQLISSVINKKNQSFSISLMASYVDVNISTNNFLISNLSKPNLANSIAFALSKSKISTTLKKLESMFLSSNTSGNTKKYIKFALRLNNSVEAQNILLKLVNKEGLE